eukprot:GHVL01018808.1.p1 GENE.GHVL01018808.1~~GHVL01018808.1.p1  ORF type:complete len:927 (+),score=129.87 GHVL01018808.1:23-2782(+)
MKNPINECRHLAHSGASLAARAALSSPVLVFLVGILVSFPFLVMVNIDDVDTSISNLLPEGNEVNSLRGDSVHETFGPDFRITALLHVSRGDANLLRQNAIKQIWQNEFLIQNAEVSDELKFDNICVPITTGAALIKGGARCVPMSLTGLYFANENGIKTIEDLQTAFIGSGSQPTIGEWGASRVPNIFYAGSAFMKSNKENFPFKLSAVQSYLTLFRVRGDIENASEWESAVYETIRSQSGTNPDMHVMIFNEAALKNEMQELAQVQIRRLMISILSLILLIVITASFNRNVILAARKAAVILFSVIFSLIGSIGFAFGWPSLFNVSLNALSLMPVHLLAPLVIYFHLIALCSYENVMPKSTPKDISDKLFILATAEFGARIITIGLPVGMALLLGAASVSQPMIKATVIATGLGVIGCVVTGLTITVSLFAADHQFQKFGWGGLVLVGFNNLNNKNSPKNIARIEGSSECGSIDDTPEENTCDDEDCIPTAPEKAESESRESQSTLVGAFTGNISESDRSSPISSNTDSPHIPFETSSELEKSDFPKFSIVMSYLFYCVCVLFMAVYLCFIRMKDVEGNVDVIDYLPASGNIRRFSDALSDWHGGEWRPLYVVLPGSTITSYHLKETRKQIMRLVSELYDDPDSGGLIQSWVNDYEAFFYGAAAWKGLGPQGSYFESFQLSESSLASITDTLLGSAIGGILPSQAPMCPRIDTAILFKDSEDPDFFYKELRRWQLNQNGLCEMRRLDEHTTVNTIQHKTPWVHSVIPSNYDDSFLKISNESIVGSRLLITVRKDSSNIEARKTMIRLQNILTKYEDIIPGVFLYADWFDEVDRNNAGIKPGAVKQLFIQALIIALFMSFLLHPIVAIVTAFLILVSAIGAIAVGNGSLDIVTVVAAVSSCSVCAVDFTIQVNIDYNL